VDGEENVERYVKGRNDVGYRIQHSNGVHLQELTFY